MAEAFSVESNSDHYLSVHDDERGVVVRVHGDTHNGVTGVIQIVLDPEDLARVLLSASAGFGTAVGVIVNKAITEMLQELDTQSS